MVQTMLSDWALKLKEGGSVTEPLVKLEIQLLAFKWSQHVKEAMVPLPWDIYQFAVPPTYPKMSPSQWIQRLSNNDHQTFDNFKM
ncbi:unnamed protein product, partial [Didymodactylos carnosus]